MLVKYNGVELPDLPQGLLEDYPYVFIRKDNTNKCYDLSLSNSILYYSSSQSMLKFPSGTAKWYQIPFSATIDENTEWVFKNTYYGYDYWELDSNRTLVWSMFDIPSGSVTSTTIYFAGSPIEYPAIKKYLVRDNDTIYTVTEGALAEVTGELNSNLFIDNGIDTIPDGALLMTLSAPEVLCWTDASEPCTLTATVQGVPTGAHAVISDHIQVNHPSIYGISSVVATASDGATFLLSFDGVAWMKYNDGTWSASDVGMTAAELMAIPSNAWSSVINSAQYMQLKATLEGVETVTQVVFNYNNESPTS